jgi:hypothetical protein
VAGFAILTAGGTIPATSLRHDWAGEVVCPGRFLIATRRCNVEVIGFVFGLIGFTFAISALAKIRKLEKQLEEAGVLKRGSNQAESRGA